MRIIIRFKSGFELPITCESFSITQHPMTDEIAGYDIKGIKDNKPIFFRSEDIECRRRQNEATRYIYTATWTIKPIINAPVKEK